MEHYGVIIVGGGAAGLFVRANLPQRASLLLEAGNEAGRKLLLTGGGMCNLTNTLDPRSFLTHFASNGQRNFLLPALQNFTPDDTRRWFAEHGLPTVDRGDGKVFPQSMKSRDVRSCLLSSSDSPIFYQQRVSSVQQINGRFIVTTDQNTYSSDTVVLSSGGMSVPKTGSDGSGYTLAKHLGHSIVPPHPALVGLVIKDYRFAAVSGSAIREAAITVTHSGESKPYYRSTGDVLFTHRGLSGPAILTLSGSVRSGDVIHLTLLTDANELIARAAPAIHINTLLKEAGLTRALATVLLDLALIDGKRRVDHLRRTERSALVNLLTSLPFVVERTMGFSAAMVTRGGVALGEVDRKTMESRLCKNLFFCGEILDYDGESGGYNLQGAFSTAMLAAQHM